MFFQIKLSTWKKPHSARITELGQWSLPPKSSVHSRPFRSFKISLPHFENNSKVNNTGTILDLSVAQVKLQFVIFRRDPTLWSISKTSWCYTLGLQPSDPWLPWLPPVRRYPRLRPSHSSGHHRGTLCIRVHISGRISPGILLLQTKGRSR